MANGWDGVVSDFNSWCFRVGSSATLTPQMDSHSGTAPCTEYRPCSWALHCTASGATRLVDLDWWPRRTFPADVSRPLDSPSPGSTSEIPLTLQHFPALDGKERQIPSEPRVALAALILRHFLIHEHSLNRHCNHCWGHRRRLYKVPGRDIHELL